MVKKISKKATVKINKTATPPRASGGKFVSANNPIVDEPKSTTASPSKESDVSNLFPTSFSGHEVRRFYQNNIWFYSIDDIGRIPSFDPGDPHARSGDLKKLADEKSKCCTTINGVEVAKAKDILPLIPYFKGTMPGQFSRWLEKNSQQTAPTVNLSHANELPQP